MLVALAGEDGISQADLGDALPATASHSDGISRAALHKRISALRKASGLSVVSSGGGYRLDIARGVAIDSHDFVRAVEELPDDAPVHRLDDLMSMWRGRPWPAPQTPTARVWQPLLKARRELVRRIALVPQAQRGRLTNTPHFVGLFPDDHELNALRALPSTRRKPTLLVVEDQIIDRICTVLGDEYQFVRVTCLEEWNDVCDHLRVNGALIDRHLGGGADDLGTTKVAAYLRRHTEIPASLMSVAPPPRYSSQTTLRLKYRLLEIVHKGGDGRSLEEGAIVQAAQDLVSTTPAAKSLRQRLWVESDAFHVEDAARFADTRSSPANERARQCRAEADRLLLHLPKIDIEDAEAAVSRFHAKWGPQGVATL